MNLKHSMFMSIPRFLPILLGYNLHLGGFLAITKLISPHTCVPLVLLEKVLKLPQGGRRRNRHGIFSRYQYLPLLCWEVGEDVERMSNEYNTASRHDMWTLDMVESASLGTTFELK